MKTKIKTLDVLVALFYMWCFLIISAMAWQGIEVMLSYV